MTAGHTPSLARHPFFVCVLALGALPRASTAAVEASYGFGYLAHRATLKP